MSEADAIARAAERTATEADRLSAAFARNLARVMRDTERALRDWLTTQPERPSPGARVQVQRIVQTTGYDELAAAATRAPFDEMATRMLAARQAAELAVDTSAATLARLDAWRTWHLEDLLLEGAVTSRSLADAVMRGVGRSRRRLPQDLGQILDRAETRVQTLYDTALSVYGRQVEAEQAGPDPATTFLYVGPVDAKTRPFCLRHVGRVYTRKEIDAMNNGQLSNVFLTGGGWNCRHVFQEISKFSALHGTGGAPEILDAVAKIHRKKAA